MSHLMKSLPAPSWLRDLVDATASYQELLGWPVSVQVGQQNLVVAVGQVLDAVTIPAALGSSVRAQLEPTPIMTNSTGTSWTFLVKPAPFLVDGVPGLRVHGAGCQVVIPAAMALTTGGAERWIECPVPNRSLPSTGDVVDAARTYYRHLDKSA
jgi:hypothetical protein